MMIRGQRQEMAMGMANTVTMERYLPMTTLQRETGEVRSSWSVRE